MPVEQMLPQRAARDRASTLPALTPPQSAWNASDGAAEAPGNEHAAPAERHSTRVVRDAMNFAIGSCAC